MLKLNQRSQLNSLSTFSIIKLMGVENQTKHHNSVRSEMILFLQQWFVTILKDPDKGCRPADGGISIRKH